MEKDYIEIKKSNLELKFDKKCYRVFTKGSFDCVHLGHFLLFANIKFEVAKYFDCSIGDIKLTAILSEQGGGIHKGIHYTQSEEEREALVLSSGLVDSVEFCDETIDFICDNHDRMDVFIIGFDQANTSYFKKVIETLESNKILPFITSERVSNLSSTLIRNTMKEQGIDLSKAKNIVESNYKLDQKSSYILSLFYVYSIIKDENMKNFNLSLLNFIGNDFKIYLGGCQGTGKTTIAKQFVEKYPIFDRFTSSEAFIEFLGITKEELEFVNEADPYAIDNMIKFITIHHQKMLLDGHFSFGERTQQSEFDLKIFISAPIEEILKRKMTDRARVRTDNLTIEKVFAEYYLKLVRACKFSSKVFVLENTGNIEDTVKKMEKITIFNTLPEHILRQAKITFADDLLRQILSPKIDRRETKLMLDCTKKSKVDYLIK